MPIGNWANSQQHNATFSLSVALTCKRKKKERSFWDKDGLSQK